jgi:predicted lipid-binding transport protein (Tim44 family)
MNQMQITNMLTALAAGLVGIAVGKGWIGQAVGMEVANTIVTILAPLLFAALPAWLTSNSAVVTQAAALPEVKGVVMTSNAGAAAQSDNVVGPGEGKTL